MRTFTLRSMAAGWTIGRSADLLRFISQLFHPQNTGANAACTMRCKRYRGLSPASPDDDLVALLPVQIQVRFFTSQPCNVTCEGGGQRTCRPLDRGQNSTKCTSLRRALGIVGDSCQEHGEGMQGERGRSQSCSITSFAPNRRRASSPRTEPSRILSLERTLRLLPCLSLSAT